MTDIDLGQFEGRDVARSRIAVKRAGDGLSEAMKIEPVLLHQGNTVYVVLECVVGSIAFTPIKDTGVVERVQSLNAGVAVLIDRDAVIAALDEQRERNRRAREAATGQGNLVEYLDLADEHNAGQHDDLVVEECPQCQARAEIGT